MIVDETARPLSISSADIAEHIGQDIAIEAARTAARAGYENNAQSGRVTLSFSGGWMRLMAACLPSLGVFGYKEFHLADANKVRYAVHLFEVDSGRPVGIVDAASITTLRTAATGAVAAEAYFGPDAERLALAVVGSGAEAEAGVLALSHVLDLKSVRVTSRSEQNRTRLADRLRSSHDLDAQPAETPAAALEGADLAYVATNSGGQIVLTNADLEHVPFVASVGSTLPQQRELAGDAFVAATHVFVDTFDALSESGDMLEARDLGLAGDRVRLVGAMRDAELGRTGLTLYKSIGSPDQDIALAHAIVEHARENGFGRTIAPLQAVKVNL